VLEYGRTGTLMAYEIWEMRTGNLVASFGREAAALELVRDAVREHGEKYGLNLALVREDSDGTSTAVATGSQLIERARVIT
jgi:hypothetical protein